MPEESKHDFDINFDDPSLSVAIKLKFLIGEINITGLKLSFLSITKRLEDTLDQFFRKSITDRGVFWDYREVELKVISSLHKLRNELTNASDLIFKKTENQYIDYLLLTVRDVIRETVHKIDAFEEDRKLGIKTTDETIEEMAEVLMRMRKLVIPHLWLLADLLPKGSSTRESFMKKFKKENEIRCYFSDGSVKYFKTKFDQPEYNILRQTSSSNPFSQVKSKILKLLWKEKDGI